MHSSSLLRPLVLALSTLACACGGSAETGLPPATVGPSDTIGFVPTSIDASRFVTNCPSQTPAGGGVALYSLNAIGAKSAAPYEGLSVSFPATTPVGVAISLTVSPLVANGGGQSATAGGVALGYSPGAATPFIDKGAFDAASVTIVSAPVVDGAPLTVHLSMHFADGRVLDETFTGPMVTETSGCAAG